MDLEIFKGSRFYECGKWTLDCFKSRKVKFFAYRIVVDTQNIQLIIMLLGNSKNTSGETQRTLILLNLIKFSDRTKLLLPKNSCDIPKVQMIPEHSLEESLVSEWDHQGLDKQ